MGRKRKHENPAAKQKAYRIRRRNGYVASIHRGTNAGLLSKVAKLYLRPGAKVADVTYGKGVFWRGIDLAGLGVELHRSDVATVPAAPYDFRCLPYADSTFDVVVLDPPYVHTGARPIPLEANYRNYTTTPSHTHADIVELYRQGMSEAFRVLRSGGRTWVKCKDEVESGRQCWTQDELSGLAAGIGFLKRDLFILDFGRTTLPRGDRQRHAWKTHSYLIVLEKPMNPSETTGSPEKRVRSTHSKPF